jgi:hypothetical protein
MSPLQLAEALVWHGIRVDRADEGDEQHDGSVRVADLVNVQVPTFGGPPWVTVHTMYDDMRCYPPRDSVAELAKDIRDALHAAPPCELASCSIH